MLSLLQCGNDAAALHALLVVVFLFSTLSKVHERVRTIASQACAHKFTHQNWVCRRGCCLRGLTVVLQCCDC